MLLRFGVGNFRSIKNYCEVSLVASEAIKDKGPGLLAVPGSKLRVLPFLLIYGANASGKSALYNAMGLMKTQVLTSFTSRKPDAPIVRTPFALDPECANAPTRVDCDFVVDGVRYHYGFEFNDEVYLQEWLYSYPEGYKRILFHRDGPKSIEFGSTLRGRNKVISDLNRANSLFLSAAAQNGHAQLTPIYSWFTRRLYGASPTVNNVKLQKRISRNLDDRLVPFLRNADTGIVGADVSSEGPPEEVKAVFKSIREAVKQHNLDDGTELQVTEPDETTTVTLAHTAIGGGTVGLPFPMESRGTRRLIDILMYAFKALDGGGTLFVDELDASLHTLLASNVLNLFADPEINRSGAQLIATTHDTNILCSDQVRRDQIWFTEKDTEGATTVYPLTDIRTRNTDNLEKGYLQGRFGAIPFLGSVKELWSDLRHG